ncbi:molybdate ABC transporter substrate-binding protein [Cryobacterium sp. TMT1-3]|uniref:Molybdate ABC transporter substrate-binding protein n=1 Tax=Cryobacterium luteum TaxID=1424661 RepID=A0A1H8A941_9MICO|nr:MULTISPECIES: molybdate ABC transporter substrate-binding protein [Cryobacterium]TFB88414.1 molybdate ABC transporter substrate-binding protein [Cryobacterium luteum]TFC24441.1 molybdate ABC transporter substrate-binding protein [Cryobacterium sp. TMT1-3]SEM66309.1 molybdate transport system substrate-binding protein [Cryobacterium luteum]
MTRLALATLAVLALTLTGCAPSTATDAGSPATELEPQTLSVYAAASLTGAFDALAVLLEDENPGIDVQVTYDGSATLATQIRAGAPADVFASADQINLQPLASAGYTGPATLFAGNTLRIAVAPGNPLKIENLEDLARPGVITVLCAAQVPCGAASATLLANAGVTLTPASEEQNVTAVVTKIAGGEADAGLVYTTDVAANPGRVEGVTPAGADAVVGHYPIAVVQGSAHAAAAQAFVDLVLSPAGQAVLAAHGFLAP